MLTNEEITRFHEQGFLKGHRVLDASDVEVLREELDRVIRDREGDGPKPVHIVNLTRDDSAPVWQVVNIWQASEAFCKLMNHPAILEEIAQLTGGRELRIWHDQIQYKPAGHGGVNMWHQENPLWPIIDPPNQVTAWVALDDVDESNGCMSMVRGSHLWGDQMAVLREIPNFGSMPASWQEHNLDVVRCPVGKGEVHYHHSLTWHGSHSNTSNRPRRAIAYHYMTEETYYIAAGNLLHCRWKPCHEILC